MAWIETVAHAVAEHGAAVRVTVVRADGSTPRETGAAMLVAGDTVHATIGGGALELQAIAHARALLAALTPSLPASPTSPPAATARGEGARAAPSWQRDVRDFALGPSLGQCCGGHTRLLFEVFTVRERGALDALARDCDADRALLLRPLVSGLPLHAAVDRREHRADWPLSVTRAVRDMLTGARARAPLLMRGGTGAAPWFIEPFARTRHRLYLYGAGHVGRALVHVLRDLPFDIAWIDTAAVRFPDEIPAHARAHIAADPAAFAAHTAAGDAFHLVLTYSHALDLAICHGLLRRGDARFVGLIGSRTKRARFLKRLSDLGVGEAGLARLTCPIGLPGLGGKEPGMIAIAVAAQLVRLAQASAAEAPQRQANSEGAP